MIRWIQIHQKWVAVGSQKRVKPSFCRLFSKYYFKWAYTIKVCTASYTLFTFHILRVFRNVFAKHTKKYEILTTHFHISLEFRVLLIWWFGIIAQSKNHIASQHKRMTLFSYQSYNFEFSPYIGGVLAPSFRREVAKTKKNHIARQNKRSTNDWQHFGLEWAIFDFHHTYTRGLYHLDGGGWRYHSQKK